MKNIVFSTLIFVHCELVLASSTGQSLKNKTEYANLGESNEEFACCINNPPPEAYPTSGFGMGAAIHDNASESIEQKNTLQQTSTLLGKILDSIPDKNLQYGLREYIKIVNPKAYGDNQSIGSSNKGLNSWFGEKFARNLCYRDAAKRFYHDVALTMSKGNKCAVNPEVVPSSTTNLVGNLKKIMKKKKADEYGCFNERPSINDTVGKRNKSYLHEGWLWQLAMKHSQGSPESAMELIGMCGHDDTAQAGFGFYDDSIEAQTEIKEQLKQYKHEKKQIDEQLKKYTRNSNDFRILNQKSERLLKRINLFKDMKGQIRNMECPPQNSDFYLPGSIGSDIDITQSLKKKISSIQNPDGKNFIPAKNYHIYGSAFLGCKMTTNGLTVEQATTVQKLAARLYRGFRMCESVKSDLKIRENLSEKMKTDGGIEDSKNIETTIITMWNQKNQKRIKCSDFNVHSMGGFGYIDKSHKEVLPPSTSYEVKSQTLNPEDENLCSTLGYFGISNLEPSEINIVKSKIAKAYSKYDAAVLYDKWYIGGGSLLGKNIPCTDIRLRGPKDLLNPNEGILSGLSKPPGWSNERYQAATQKLATWDVDFEWTVKQHEIGSKFGATVCKSGSKPSPFKDEKKCLKSAYGDQFDGYKYGEHLNNVDGFNSSKSTRNTK